MARLRKPASTAQSPVFSPPSSSSTLSLPPPAASSIASSASMVATNNFLYTSAQSQSTPTRRPPTPRRSPRKPAIRESPSTRSLRYTLDAEDASSYAALIPKIPTSSQSPTKQTVSSELGTPTTVRRQRALRPVASNSRLLQLRQDKDMDASFGSENGFDASGGANFCSFVDWGLQVEHGLLGLSGEKGVKQKGMPRGNGGGHLRYSKFLAKSVVRGRERGKMGAVGVVSGEETRKTGAAVQVLEMAGNEVQKSDGAALANEGDMHASGDRVGSVIRSTLLELPDDIQDMLPASAMAAEEEVTLKELVRKAEVVEEAAIELPLDPTLRGEEEGEDEEEEPVITRRRDGRPCARRLIFDSESSSEDEEDDLEDDDAIRSDHEEAVESKSAIDMPPPILTACRLPFRKGRTTTSNQHRDVIDLTSSPEAHHSHEIPDLPVRSASFASSPRASNPPSTRPSTADSCDADAVLRFSPTPMKWRSPCKAPPIARPTTPPLPGSPSKLVSPTKKNPRIPQAPNLRPSIDAFWSPAIVNEWTDQHSPSKPLLSPRKQKLIRELERQMAAIDLSLESDSSFSSPISSPKKKRTQNPSKAAPCSPSVAEIRQRRKEFDARKHQLAESFLRDLDETVTSGRIAELSSSTGGIHIVWSKTLKTTAGRANWRREQVRCRTGSSPQDVTTQIRHHCSIELADKIIDDEARLHNTLAHEFCHLATFMVSGVRNNPHGAEFKAWGRKVSAAFAHLAVEVTTKHSYSIAYKFAWACVACGFEFKRHSRSVDPVRHSCGRCRGRLVQTKPVPRGVRAGSGGVTAASVSGDVAVSAKPGAAAGKKTEYQIYVKQHFGRVKRDMAQRGEQDTSLGKVMEVLGREYRAWKEGRNGNAGATKSGVQPRQVNKKNEEAKDEKEGEAVLVEVVEVHDDDDDDEEEGEAGEVVDENDGVELEIGLEGLRL